MKAATWRLKSFASGGKQQSHTDPPQAFHSFLKHASLLSSASVHSHNSSPMGNKFQVSLHLNSTNCPNMMALHWPTLDVRFPERAEALLTQWLMGQRDYTHLAYAHSDQVLVSCLKEPKKDTSLSFGSFTSLVSLLLLCANKTAVNSTNTIFTRRDRGWSDGDPNHFLEYSTGHTNGSFSPQGRQTTWLKQLIRVNIWAMRRLHTKRKQFYYIFI